MERPDPEFSTDPMRPPERGRPQTGPSYPQGGPVRDEYDDEPVSRETGGDVPRETVSYRPPTASDFADHAAAELDQLTPLAYEAQQSVLARAGLPPVERPDATRVFVVANQKGGVGKTTSTVNLAAALTQLGQRVLVIDLDPQGNASTALNVEHQQGVTSTYELLVDGTPMTEMIRSCPDLPRLSVVPATIDLAGAEIELVSVVAREGRLKKAIAAHPAIGTAAEVGEERYDYVFIDCPPSLGLLTLNALVAGEEMLIPIQAEYYALEGLGQLLATVDMVRAHLNPELAVTTIVLTMYDSRTRLAHGVAHEVREHFGTQVIDTAIPRSVRVSEAPSYGQTVMTYDPASSGAMSYLEAAREIAKRGVRR